jgi:hypothetical protein
VKIEHRTKGKTADTANSFSHSQAALEGESCALCIKEKELVTASFLATKFISHFTFCLSAFVFSRPAVFDMA